MKKKENSAGKKWAQKKSTLWKVWKMLYSKKKSPSINCIFCSIPLKMENFLFYHCFLGWILLFGKGKNDLSSVFAVTHISFGDHSFYVPTWFCSHCNSNVCKGVPLLLQCIGDVFSHLLSITTTCKLGVLVWFFTVYLIFFCIINPYKLFHILKVY